MSSGNKKPKDQHCPALLNDSEYKTFEFVSTDNSLRRGNKWCPWLTCLIFCCLLLVLSNWWIRLIVIIMINISLMVIIFLCYLQHSNFLTKKYVLTFNDNKCCLVIICNKKPWAEVSYDLFDELDLSMMKHRYQFCYCWIKGFRTGWQEYKGGAIIIKLKTGKNLQINDNPLTVKETQNANKIITKINNHWNKINHKNLLKININLHQNEEEEKNDLEDFQERAEGQHYGDNEQQEEKLNIGSFCFVGNESVYGVIIDHGSHNNVKIIDLVENNEKLINKTSLTLIKDKNLIKKAQKEHDIYLQSNYQLNL